MTDTSTQPKKAKASTSAKNTAKVVTEEVVESTAPARKKVTKSKAAEQVVGSTAVTHEQRLAWIAEAAYYRAEQRGFSGGDEASDWLAAEAQVDAMLLRDQPKPE